MPNSHYLKFRSKPQAEVVFEEERMAGHVKIITISGGADDKIEFVVSDSNDSEEEVDFFVPDSKEGRAEAEGEAEI